MLDFLRKKRTFHVLGGVGATLLAAYLIVTRDFRISPIWVGWYIGITFASGMSWATLARWGPMKRLERYHFRPQAARPGATPATDEKNLSQRQLDFAKRARLRDLLMVPTEDGLICVPMLLTGIHPAVVIACALAFGFLHMVNHTYLDCIGKALRYTLLSMLILPHGILNMVAGHVLMDLFAFAALKMLAAKFGSPRALEASRPN